MVCVFVALLLFALIHLPKEKVMFVCEWCKDEYQSLSEGPYCSWYCTVDHWVHNCDETRYQAAECGPCAGCRVHVLEGGQLCVPEEQKMFFDFEEVLKRHTAPS